MKSPAEDEADGAAFGELISSTLEYPYITSSVYWREDFQKKDEIDPAGERL